MIRTQRPSGPFSLLPILAALLLLVLAPLPALAADTDGDGVLDSVDNCTTVSNANQRDTNTDGYGNRCDADLNNDLLTNTLDLNIWRLAKGSVPGKTNWNANADFNGDNKINTADRTIFNSLNGRPPGPSASTPPPPAPAVSCTSAPASGTAPLNVVFGSTPSGATGTYTYLWNFGDGSATSTLQNPSHSYAIGNYTATVTVTSGGVASAPCSKAIAVTAPLPPLVSCTVTPASGTAPLNAIFSSTPSGGTGSYTYLWNFGDGSATSTLQNPSHSYAIGNYTATVTVTSGGVATAPCSKAIEVTAGPPSGAGFSFTTYGDSRAGGSPPCDGNKIHRTLVGLMAAENTAFTVHNGDMIEGFGSDTNFIQDGNCTAPDSFGSLKNLIEPLQSRPAPAGLPMSFFPVIGNHDDAWAIGWYPDSFGNGICDVFNMGALVPNHTQKPWFSLNKSTSYSDAIFSARLCSKTKPGVVIAGVEQPDIYPRYAYYSFDYQNSHFVVLHLNRDIDDIEECNSCGSDKTDYDDYYNIHQLDFVKADLAAARGNSAIANIFVFLHVPLFGTSDSHINNPSWQALGKVFTNNGVKPVKAVFSGHSHVYERSKRIAIDTAHPTGVENNTTGTAYITTGGGGSPLNGWNPIQWYTAFRYAAYHYVRVDVVGSQTTIKVVGYDPATPPAPTFTIETLTW